MLIPRLWVRVPPPELPLSVEPGPVAQWSERGTHNPLVAGSIPAGPTVEVLVRRVLHGSPPARSDQFGHSVVTPSRMAAIVATASESSRGWAVDRQGEPWGGVARRADSVETSVWPSMKVAWVCLKPWKVIRGSPDAFTARAKLAVHRSYRPVPP